MDILCLSDIVWGRSRSDTTAQICADIRETDPSLVLFAGDVINDGRNRREHVDEFLEVLHDLEDAGIQSFTIQGNHDVYSDYDAVVQEVENLQYAEEISGAVGEFRGLKVAGIPYSMTHSLEDAKHIAEAFPSRYDVVLAHAETSRRIWLFEVDAPFIITGHTDEILCQIQDTVFVSLDSYPDDRVVLNPEDRLLSYRRYDSPPFSSHKWYKSEVQVVDDELEWLLNEYDTDDRFIPNLQDRNRKYAARTDALISAKAVIEGASQPDEERIVEELLDLGVPKTHIREYLSGYEYLALFRRSKPGSSATHGLVSSS